MSNVPDHLKHYESMSLPEIEKEVLKFRNTDPRSLTEEDLDKVIALHAIATRKTSGPPRTRTKPVPVDIANIDFG